MENMFRPIKKIFTYIQKNASNGTMFGSTSSLNNTVNEATSSGCDSSSLLEQEDQQLEQDADLQLQNDDDDIERQIKTSIIDASKVHAAKSKMVLPLQLQLDDELADFAHEPLTVDVEDVDDEELDEQYLELDNYPNNEIIVLSENELNSSLNSDNISEDPLAIDDFTQPLEPDEAEADVEPLNSADLLWLKLDTPTPVQPILAVTAVKTTPTKTKEEELRSDGGSDSGLGNEHDRHNTTTVSSAAATTTRTITNDLHQPLRSNLKRRLDDDAMDLALGAEISGNSSTNCCSSTPQKRPKRCINFDSVKVYYFPRQQGFNCVPTAGGCTLGMGARHIAFKTMTLAEHAAELRRAHRSQNQEQQQQLQLRTNSGLGSSSEDSEESEEDYLSEGSGSDADDGSNGFLQPVTPKQRRALLKAAGVRKIDASEKIDCRDIRNSREVCGCSCREFCDPETCACSQAGIKCQVDRAMFPCGCTREACGNTVGRVEFNPTRVRTHYIHTVMRLDMEQRQSQAPPAGNGNTLIYGSSPTSGSSSNSSNIGAAGVVTGGATNASHCFFMQPQSNYSSGYASPAYTPETSVSYYQQQQTPQTATSVVSAGSAGNSVTAAQQSSYATGYPQLDTLDTGLFASGSNATPSYGELLTPTFHQTLGYGNAQLNSYTAYQQTSGSSVAGGVDSPGGYSSCAVPSVPPFGNATTTASNSTQYQHTNALETTAASMNASSSISMVTSSTCATVLTRLSGGGGGANGGSGSAAAGEFISLNTPLNSSSRLSQINDLLQHNRSTTAALVAVSESFAAVRSNGNGNGRTTTSSIDSIDTPPIVEDTQRSCMTFEELPPPLINPTPIVAVVEQQHKQLLATTPQPRQALDATKSLAGGTSSSSSTRSSGN